MDSLDDIAYKLYIQVMYKGGFTLIGIKTMVHSRVNKDILHSKSQDIMTHNYQDVVQVSIFTIPCNLL